jgi:hypothetical protein
MPRSCFFLAAPGVALFVPVFCNLLDLEAAA